MITSENNTTTVQFAAMDNVGKIGVGVRGTTIQLQELLSEINVGESLTSDDIKDLPKVLLEFSNVNSIDVLIKALNAVKENWTKKYAIALAC